jgi:hypothetical protein
MVYLHYPTDISELCVAGHDGSFFPELFVGFQGCIIV